MKTKKLFLGCILALLLIVLCGLSFVYGYFVIGLQHTNDMIVRTNCDILMVETLGLLSLSENSSEVDLIEKIELNLETTASFIENNKPYSTQETQERISKTLIKYEEARDLLKQLREEYNEKKNT